MNEQLASVRLSYLCHRMPGLRWLGQSTPPLLYFKWIRLVAQLAFYTYPADWRRMQHMRQALKANFSRSTLRTMTQRNILYREWFKALIYGWPSWVGRLQDWVSLEGEEHLTQALGQGRGAVLLSGHAYGLPTMVAPVLSQKGYKLNRTGRGLRGDPEKRWGRQWDYENWAYHTFGQDFWQHVRALNRMRIAMSKNEVLHLLIRGFRQGNPNLEIEFYYKRFFLDPLTFRIIETLQAPVLPCFALCDDQGRLTIKIHPALPPSTEEIMRVFGPLYSNHLRERPEFAYFWRRMVRQQESW